LSDTDYAIYRLGNGTLAQENIFCNTATSRCNRGTDVMEVNFTNTCINGVEMMVNPYNSYTDGAPDIEYDGIIVVEFTNAADSARPRPNILQHKRRGHSRH